MNYRDAMVFIKKEKTNNTITLVQTRDMRDLFTYYYNKDIFRDYKNVDADLNKEGIYTITRAEDLKAIDFTKYNKVILTQTFVQQNKENEAFLFEIAAHYKHCTFVNDYEGIVIVVFN
jgi:hypothetical protein